MAKYIINGLHKLSGKITPSGNKNSALPLIAASLIIKGKVKLTNVPRISDVTVQLDTLKDLGANIWYFDKGHTIIIDSEKISKNDLNPEFVKKTRGTLLFIGSLLARFKKTNTPPSGGCKLGKRPLEPYLTSLEQLGCQVKYDGTNFLIDATKAKSTEVWQEEAGVVGTEIMIMFTSLLSGKTKIVNAACEPHVQDLCNLLNMCGAKIEGVGTNTLYIEGVSELNFPQDTSFRVGDEHIEIGTFIALAAVTHSELTIENIKTDYLGKIIFEFKKLGVNMEVNSSSIKVLNNTKLQVKDMIDGSLNKLECRSWPGFPPDLLQIALAVAVFSKGQIMFFDTMYEDRFGFVTQLNNMGARIIQCDPHRLIVNGVEKLYRSKALKCTDLRAGIALLLAALATEGESELSDIEMIERGYEDLVERLNQLGAKIQKVNA